MAIPNDESVDYDIRIHAAQAIKDLRQVALEANNAARALGRVSSSRNNNDMVPSAEDFERWKRAAQGAQTFGDKSQDAFHRAVTGINAYRIALGAIISMLLFQGLQAVTSFFKGAMDQAKQFEVTLYRISNAERELSKAGVEVTVKGLKEGIDSIQEALPIFSKEDVSELIGGIATTTKELGFAEDEMLKLGAAVSILNLKSTEAESLLQTMGKVVNSVISPQAKSIGTLGLAFGKANIEAKALDMQILKTGETFDKLTEKEKTKIKYQIVLDTAGIGGIDDIKELRDLIKDAGGDFAALDAYLQSNAAKIDENTAAWKDFQTTVGQLILPFIPVLTGFLSTINGGFQVVKVGLIELAVAGKAFLLIWNAISTLRPLNVEEFRKSLDELRAELTNDFFKDVPKDAPKWFMNNWGKHIKEQAETATGVVKDFGDAIEEIDTSALEKVADIFKDTADAVEDLAGEIVRKLDDLDTEYQRKALDAETDYIRKKEDINRDYERDIAELKKKHREEDERDEAKYQLALWELRMRYLMDLEDALHSRDARQVIRLQKQYNLDKETLRRKHELEGKDREESQAAELEDAELKRQQRLADAKIEYEQKLADLNTAKQREQEDLAIWYQREFEDIQQAQDRKLKALLDGWAKEQALTQENAAAIYAILQKYFGPGGMTDGLYQYMMSSLLQVSANAAAVAGQMALLGSIGGGYGGGGHTTTDTESGGSTGGEVKIKKGRMENPYLASRPAGMFGSIPDSIPVNQIGRGNQGMSGSNLGRTGMEGAITVEVSLSPDLEARVVQNSMDGVANVISRVTNSK